jgi:hypothetical protein
LDTVNKKSAAEVSNVLCEAIGETSSPNNGTKSAATLNQLERLAALKDKGILTDAEFLAQKEKILSGPNGPQSLPAKIRSRVEPLEPTEPALPRRPPEVATVAPPPGEKPAPTPGGLANKPQAPARHAPFPTKKRA